MTEFVTKENSSNSIQKAEVNSDGKLSELPDRLPRSYNILPLTFLTADDFTFIEIKAKALTLEEILHYLGIDPEEDDIPPKELLLARKAWRRGRVNGIATAADKLFDSMSEKNGGSIAMEYLKQLSDTFHISPDSPQSSSQPFSFKVILDD